MAKNDLVWAAIRTTEPENVQPAVKFYVEVVKALEAQNLLPKR
jgi:hypothetical protein